MVLTSVGNPAVERSSSFHVLENGFGSSAILLSLLDRCLHSSCNSLALHCSLVHGQSFGNWKVSLWVRLWVRLHTRAVNGAEMANVCHFSGECDQRRGTRTELMNTEERKIAGSVELSSA